MELEFKEGERVFDIRYGWGTIREPINECFTAVIFDKDRIIECYDERNAVTMLSYEEYELHGRCSTNYRKYVGKWGVFTDYVHDIEDAFIGILKDVCVHNGNMKFAVETQGHEVEMKRFIPLTDDMLKRLNLENK